jgi:MoxR-like ATPase
MGSEDPIQPFASSLDHLRAELERIDMLVRIQASRARQAAGGEPFRGLSLSDEEVQAALDRPMGEPHWASAPAAPSAGELPAILSGMLEQIEARRVESERQNVLLRLPRLAALFGLTRFDIDLLLIAFAPELDLRYERLFAYLHDDVTRKRPGVDLALGLLCATFEDRVAAWARLSPSAPLLRHSLIKLFADAAQEQPVLLGCSLKVDERIAAYLHGLDELDKKLSPFARLATPRLDLHDLLLSAKLKTRLAQLVNDAAAQEGQVVYFQGLYGVGKETAAGAVCRALGRSLLVASLRSLLDEPPDRIETLIRLALREARIQGATLYWEDFDLILTDDRRAVRQLLLQAIDDFPGLTFLAGKDPWHPSDALHTHPFTRIAVDLPTPADRVKLWMAALAGEPPVDHNVDLDILSNRYRLSAGQIRDAAATAQSMARFRDPAAGRVTMSDLGKACRMQTGRTLSKLASKVALSHGWKDLVLSKDRVERLREICNHARHRNQVFYEWGFDKKLSTGKGLSVLFTGPPGTGKTMAAGVLANELGLDLYQIDLSAVVSKYIGETEKQLAQIFNQAERSHAILLFDEADALFGKRSEVHDAHDRYANIETSYLLQRMETYEGLVILASNFSRNMDEAFLRRIQFTIEFSFPDERERLQIWERIWPAEVPRAADMDLPSMARRFELSGASIRNIAVAAAFLAAAEGASVGRKHLLHATRREYQKMGKMVDESLFAVRP